MMVSIMINDENGNVLCKAQPTHHSKKERRMSSEKCMIYAWSKKTQNSTVPLNFVKRDGFVLKFDRSLFQSKTKHSPS